MVQMDISAEGLMNVVEEHGKDISDEGLMDVVEERGKRWILQPRN